MLSDELKEKGEFGLDMDDEDSGDKTHLVFSWWHLLYLNGCLIGLVYKLFPLSKTFSFDGVRVLELCMVIFSVTAQKYLVWLAVVGIGVTFIRNRMPKFFNFYTTVFIVVLCISLLVLFLF